MTDLTPTSHLPADAKTGLTLPLTKSLGSQDLAKQRSMVALELEVMAKKMDRFGWDRDRGSAAHDRLVLDWMNCLCDFPLHEVQDACRKWVSDSPRKMPNEGDIKGLILAARSKVVAAIPRPPEPPARKPITADRAASILAEVGFDVKKFGGKP